MEKDIEVIVGVEPGEAQLLIELVETLIADWYIARQQQADRLGSILRVAAEKKALQKAASLSALDLPSTSA